ncbi:phage baseplate assembly protein V [Mesorhizobium sp. LjNodule214]|uniref:phage baseplate assembly protein V n=1 Tax=Mesorhizobium sp. LjNodule214 TaxID=3342252 RepID=UPI003ECCD71B
MLNTNMAMGEDQGGNRNRVYGKFAGTVMNNMDPLFQGRLQAFVPEILGEIPTGWAKPCTPYAGPTSGFFSVPPIGAGVWIEFEAGDVSRPIWAGCFWGAGELPMKPPGGPSQPTTKIWRSELGLTAVLDDLMQTITLTDALGLNSVEVSVATGAVTITGAVRVVSSAPLIQEGSAAAAHPAVLGDQLFAYLTQLVTLFNAHVHPGELALGILPVTPAPPVAPMPPPTPSLLSIKVLLE